MSSTWFRIVCNSMLCTCAKVEVDWGLSVLTRPCLVANDLVGTSFSPQMETADLVAS